MVFSQATQVFPGLRGVNYGLCVPSLCSLGINVLKSCTASGMEDEL